MVAASFWSLLSPAIESAEKSGYYGKYAFGPVAIGFALGGVFVLMSDKFIPHCVSKFFFQYIIVKNDRGLKRIAMIESFLDLQFY